MALRLSVRWMDNEVTMQPKGFSAMGVITLTIGRMACDQTRLVLGGSGRFGKYLLAAGCLRALTRVRRSVGRNK
jgi:hypothetical protein